MYKVGTAIVAAVTALLAVSNAHAARMFCDIDVSSHEGGRLSVVTWDYGPQSVKFMHDHPDVRMMPPPATISWNPPASGKSVTLEVFYGGSDLTTLSAPTDVKAAFDLPEGVKPEQLAITATSDARRSWHFTQPQTDFAADGGLWVTLATASPRDFTNIVPGEERLSVLTLSRSRRLAVTVADGHKPDQSARFDMTTVGRNQLLAYARHLVETHDPRVCRERK